MRNRQRAYSLTVLGGVNDFDPSSFVRIGLYVCVAKIVVQYIYSMSGVEYV